MKIENEIISQLQQLISTLESINQPIRNNQLHADVINLHDELGEKLKEKITKAGISLDSGII
ncbi:hypothetical protein [Pectobacterium versatile]|uniref:hypothetical protein n=1 Tax=Pectobacterium versatile TaxID=2488639 RepID=UPI00102EA02C|nr:hypothetical protein [Pectobacterium versatile]TAI92999.1 hypothetical protein EG332_22435 [Pectobacterium versatile]UEQ07680.1 hypothetical protein LLE50_12365 [Pectobacterium versatile]